MTFQIQVAIPYFTAIPEDVVTNVLHFDFQGVGAPVTSDYTDLVDITAAFYETVFLTGGTPAMASYARPALTRMKVYDLVEATPRVPKFDNTVPLTVKQGTATTMPPEVATVLSYQTNYASGIPQASQRGRIFLGALDQACFTAGSTTDFPKPNVSFINSMIAAAQQLKDTNEVTNWQWVVYSRKLGLSFPAVKGWIDNALDTQRRRGQAATARNLWSDPTP